MKKFYYFILFENKRKLKIVTKIKIYLLMLYVEFERIPLYTFNLKCQN